MIKQKLSIKLNPSWNFGPYSKNCKKVKNIVSDILKNINNNTNYTIKKNKDFMSQAFLV